MMICTAVPMPWDGEYCFLSLFPKAAIHSAGVDAPMFADRHDAGRQLVARLIKFKDQRPVVLALPRGGVAVGVEIAETLAAPLDLVLVRKIGVPWQPELALGAVVDGGHPEIFLNEDLLKLIELPQGYLSEESAKELKEIERRRRLYLGGHRTIDISGCTAIVVDDGIATGASMHAALIAVRRRNPAHLVLAVPVASPDSLAELRREVDEAVCLEAPSSFEAIGAFYEDFHQVSDDEVAALLARFSEATGQG